MKRYINTIIGLLMLLMSAPYLMQGQSIRKDYREMTAREKSWVQNAYFALKCTSGSQYTNCGAGSYDLLNCGAKVDQNAIIHCEEFNNIHTNASAYRRDSDVFLSWHRAFLLDMEQRMQNASDPSTSIPIWNWLEDPSGSGIWGNDLLGPFDNAWNLSRNRQANTDIFTNAFPYSLLMTQTVFLSSGSAGNNSDEIRGFSPLFEWGTIGMSLPSTVVGLHAAGHIYTGGAMARGVSPLDPVFYSHHGMVDRVWQEWSDIPGHQSQYIRTDMPYYGNPNNYLSSDAIGVYYAKNRRVVMKNHAVQGEEHYYYDGDIIVTSTFTADNGNKATIMFGRGYEALILPGRSRTNFHVLPIPPDHYQGGNNREVMDEQIFSEAASVSDLKESPYFIQGRQMDSEQSELLSIEGLSLYPNPADQILNIELDIASSQATVDIQIIGAKGDLLLHPVDNQLYNQGGQKFVVSLSSLVPGYYVCRIKRGEEVQHLKLVVIH